MTMARKTHARPAHHDARQEAAEPQDATIAAQEAPEALTEADAHQSAQDASEAQTPARPKSAALAALEAAEAQTRRPAAGSRAPRTPRGPTLLDKVRAIAQEAGRPVSILALARAIIATEPERLTDSKANGAVEARLTAEAARARGDEAEAEAAEARALEAARKQTEATITAAITSALAHGKAPGLRRAGKGMLEAYQAEAA
jgi:hypothetical protein